MLKQKKIISTDHFYFFFSFLFRFWSIKKILYETKIRKKKHSKLLDVAKNKLDCVEMLVSQATIDQIISRDEFAAIIEEKKDHDNHEKRP